MQQGCCPQPRGNTSSTGSTSSTSSKSSTSVRRQSPPGGRMALHSATEAPNPFHTQVTAPLWQ